MNITARPLYQKDLRKPVVDPKHLDFLKTLPCVICLRTSWIDPSHTPGERGISQKTDDHRAIPFCRAHHEEQHRIGWKRFIDTYRLNLPELLEVLTARPRFSVYRLKEPIYVAHFLGEEFVVTMVSAGLKRAIRCARDQCREILIGRIIKLQQKRESA